MSKIAKLGKIALVVFFVLSLFAYAIATVLPLLLCLGAVFYFACGSGNPFVITGSTLLLLAVVSILISPFIQYLIDRKKSVK